MMFIAHTVAFLSFFFLLGLADAKIKGVGLLTLTHVGLVTAYFLTATVLLKTTYECPTGTELAVLDRGGDHVCIKSHVPAVEKAPL